VYQPAREELADVFAAVLAQLVQIDHAFVALTDEQLLAMGAYIGLFEDWAPRTLQVPSILLRAHSPLHASLNYAQRISAWQLATREVEVPGNHFSIIDADANSTAQALQQVLEDAAGTHPTAPTPSRCHPTKQTITSHGA
jgi:thioesterase domain-containing protein